MQKEKKHELKEVNNLQIPNLNDLKKSQELIINMKTKVIIVQGYKHSEYNVGDKGYIDGYIRGANNTPYVVVIVGEKLDLVPFYCLKVLK